MPLLYSKLQVLWTVFSWTVCIESDLQALEDEEREVHEGSLPFACQRMKVLGLASEIISTEVIELGNNIL